MRQLLRERLRSEKVECKTAIVRQLLPDIEAATEAGFTYVQIAGWLAQAQGFVITGKHLAVIVSQIHKQKKGRRERPKAQLNMFEKLKSDKAAEDRKAFKHDPLENGKGLM
jgi:hypothetical protein